MIPFVQIQSAILEFTVQPYFRLAPLDQGVLRFVLLIDLRKRFARFYDVFIALHPVIEHLELINNFFLYVFHNHFLNLFLQK